MVQDLLEFMRETLPSYEASLELLGLILENDPTTSAVAKAHPRWIYINLMQQLLQLGEEEKRDWVIDLFSGRRNTAELFAESMLKVGLFNARVTGFVLILIERDLDQC